MCPVNEGSQVPGLAQWVGCDWGDQVVTDHMMAPKELRPHHSLVRPSPSSMPCCPPSQSTPAIPLICTIPVIRGIPVVHALSPLFTRHPTCSCRPRHSCAIPVIHVPSPSFTCCPRHSHAVPVIHAPSPCRPHRSHAVPVIHTQSHHAPCIPPSRMCHHPPLSLRHRCPPSSVSHPPLSTPRPPSLHLALTHMSPRHAAALSDTSISQQCFPPSCMRRPRHSRTVPVVHALSLSFTHCPRRSRTVPVIHALSPSFTHCPRRRPGSPIGAFRSMQMFTTSNGTTSSNWSCSPAAIPTIPMSAMPRRMGRNLKWRRR